MSVSDEKKPASASGESAAAVTTKASSAAVSAFSIDGLLGLKQQDTADKTIKEDTPSSEHDVYTTSAPCVTATTMAPASATAHLVYSAAATATSMVPSPALHGTLWSSHPAASIAAFRCK